MPLRLPLRGITDEPPTGGEEVIPGDRPAGTRLAGVRELSKTKTAIRRTDLMPLKLPL